MNNKKYTIKYIGDRIRQKNQEKEFSNSNLINYNNKNIIPINNFNDIYNKSSSYLNKVNIASKNENNKNKTSRKTSTQNFKKINIIEKEKENKDINEYRINNLSSSYNNNYTNIKTDKIVFIDLKNNDNLNNLMDNENQNENIKQINDKNIKNVNINNNINNSQSTYNNYIKNIKNKNIINNNVNNKFDKSKTLKKFSNLIIQKFDNQETFNNFTIYLDKKGAKNSIIMNKENNLQTLKNSKNLSIKECSYYILSKSPILRFCERMMFARSTPNIKKILSKEIIFNENKNLLENKIKELREKIALCNKILSTPFTASKTAEITLNFITSLQELEFKDYEISEINEEEKYYYNYIQILYYLLNEEFEENENIKKNAILSLRNNLYRIISNKGYKSIRDYLYSVYIKKKDEIKEIPKINEINSLIKKNNNMFRIQYSLKFSKFISFTMYLIKEIIKFGNDLKSTFELKIKAINVMDIVVKKLNKYNDKK